MRVYALGVVVASTLASLAGACNHYDGFDICPDPTRIQGDYRIAVKTFDAASYFPPGLFSTVPWWKPFEQTTPPERRDPNDNSLYQWASLLRSLGEESLYARRVEPDLHVYRVLTRTVFGGAWISRSEQRGPDAWVERRKYHHCKRRRDDAVGFNIDMSERELPDATWRAVDSCMEKHFWTVPMEDGKPPTAPRPDADGKVEAMFDGPNVCLVEGVRGGEYHAIVRVCEHPADAPSRDPLLTCVGIMESEATGLGGRP